MSAPYPITEPYDSGYFDTGDGHQLYYERHGNPQGRPVVHLHGGPGAGCSYNEYRLFNPKHFNVLLFDQRGAGKSRPYASIENNTTDTLVADMEAMRKHFGYAEWDITGGSWGSTLAMFYAAEHPERVGRMMLRGVFFADQSGFDHIINDNNSPRSQNNPSFEAYRDFIPADERTAGLMLPYYNRLTCGDPSIEMEAATLFYVWDMSIAFFKRDENTLISIRGKTIENLSLSRIFFHFAINEYKNENRAFLLAAMQHIGKPIDIIHGADDMICPVENAKALHKACPNSLLQVFENCGHGLSEPALTNAFVAITDKWSLQP